MAETSISIITDRLNPVNYQLRTPLVFAVVLTTALFVLTPLTAVALQATGVSRPLPSLAGLAVALGIYALFVIISDEWFMGALVCLLITATVAANVPLAADMSMYPRVASPAIWVFQAPLLVAVVLGTKRLWSVGTTLTEVLLFAFAGWAALGALFAVGPRPDVMLFFAFFFIEVGLIFALVSRSVRSDLLDSRDVIGIFCLAAVGHVGLALIQFLTQGPLGFSVLGETSKTVGTITVAGTTLATGGFVSGFAAGGINSLMILTIPTFGLFALQWAGWRRAPPLLMIGAMLIVQRGTANDSARGAMLLTGLSFLGAFAILNFINKKKSDRNSIVSTTFSVAVGLVVILWPGSDSGTSSDANVGVSTPAKTAAPVDTPTPQITTAEPVPTTAEPVPTTAEPVPTTAEPVPTTAEPKTTEPMRTVESATSTVPDAGTLVDNISIPFFSLRTLGVRIEQYVAGIDLFLSHPILGIGAGNFMYYARDYGLSESFRMHSLYVALLAETGIVGFLLYIGAALSGLVRIGKQILTRGTHWMSLLGMCCGLVGILALATWGPFLDTLLRVIPFWAIMGAAVGETYNSD